MHLLEQYAISCGVKIQSPHVETLYYPIPFDKYIVLHSSSGMPAKNYDYYRDVIDLLRPYLEENDIHIVQLGSPEDTPIPHCYFMGGKTNLNQSFYILQNCLLLLGNDSFSSHVAGGFDRKIVSLYSNLFKECCQPYWGRAENQTLLQADRKGKKPSFASQELDKVVNRIQPEVIGRAVLDLLGINHTLDSYNTLYTGPDYHQSAVEVVPDFFVDNFFPDDQGINLRLDYNFNLDIASRWAFNYKTHLILDDPVDPKYFNVFKNNLVKISLTIKPDTPPEYLSLLKGLGCAVELSAPSNGDISSLRSNFLDWEIDEDTPFDKKSLDSTSEICNNTKYQSSKTLFSKNKAYSSKASWVKNQEKSPDESIIDTPDFWNESRYFRIYNP